MGNYQTKKHYLMLAKEESKGKKLERSIAKKQKCIKEIKGVRSTNSTIKETKKKKREG